MKTQIKRAAVFLGLLLATTFTSWSLLPKPPLLNGMEFSRRVFDRQGKLLRTALTADGKYRVYAPLQQISPELVNATILYEDRFFRRHRGINPLAVLRCAWHFCGARATRAGASTITMQVARLRFGIRSRTLPGKVRQMFRALQLERHYTKDQILEGYFNLAPYGRNIEGAAAASQFYFGKTPAELTRHEAIALSVIPQNPSRRAPRADRDNAVLGAAQERLLSASAVGEAVEALNLRAPAAQLFRAPHFTTEILQHSSLSADIGTTLDTGLQAVVERQIRNYVESERRLGVENAAALLVDFQTMEVLAQAGSADFFGQSIQGQVDGTRSPRSPGSTLKPFVYALAIEQGLIHPLTMLKDAPASFGGYDPENFDREFLGPLHATDALFRSRNLPAVALAAQLSNPSLYDFLKRAGVILPKAKDDYGLSLVLGGAEVTMENLVRLYSALANGGVLRELRRIPGDRSATPIRVLRPEAAFLTVAMLGQATRPGGLQPTAQEGVYWKTGTSNGYRDAWCIAIFEPYILAVWIGNFDGKSNPAFVGRTAAAPLLFRIIDALDAGQRRANAPLVPPSGANLRRVEFCAVSGQLPERVCRHRVQGWFIPGISPITSCSVHREVMIDTASGLRVAVDDGTRRLSRATYEFWSSDLLALFEKAGVPRRTPPPFLPGSGGLESVARHGRRPQIISPKSAVTYALRFGAGNNASLALQAETEADVEKVYWFADKRFLGTGRPRAPLYWTPSPGVYRIVALDDHGRSSARTVSCSAAETN